jgi:hypothetical protein
MQPILQPSGTPSPAAGVPAAPNYSAAPGYYAASGYAATTYFAAPTYAPTSYYYYPASSTAAAAPVASASYLSSFAPDGQAAAGLGGFIDPSSSQARGQRILSGLRGAFIPNAGIGFEVLHQFAKSLFAREFGLTPNEVDTGVLADLVRRVINEANAVQGGGAGGRVAPGTPVVQPGTVAPSVTPGQGSVMTVSVEALGPDGKLQVVSRVTVSLGGATGAGRGNTAPMGPGNVAPEPDTGIAPSAPPTPAGATPPAQKAAPRT